MISTKGASAFSEICIDIDLDHAIYKILIMSGRFTNIFQW